MDNTNRIDRDTAELPHGTDQPTKNLDTIFTWLLVLVFASLGVVGILHHEMWRDELAHWVFVTDRPSLLKIIHDARYLGHPFMWHFFLFFIAKISHNPFGMQLFHILLATGVIYVFVKYAPFTKLQKILFTFGYYPFYEYSIISRNYVPGILMVFLFCAFYQTRLKKYWILAVMLFLMANTNLYGVFMAFTFGLGLMLEAYFDKAIFSTLASRKKDLIISFVIFVFGLVSSLYEISKPQDSTLYNGFDWDKFYSIGWIKASVLSTLWKVYFPIPTMSGYEFWNSNALVDIQIIAGPVTISGENFAIFISMGLLLFLIILFMRKPVILFYYLCSLAIGLLFNYAIFLGVLRHLGFLYIMLFACLWLADYYNESTLSNRFINNLTNTIGKYKTTFILLILVANLIAGVYAFYIDYYYPFTASYAVARYIKDQNMTDITIIGYPDYTGLPISTLLDKAIYYPESNRIGRSIILDSGRKNLDKFEAFNQITEFATKTDKPILLVLNYELQITKKNNETIPLQTGQLAPGIVITANAQFTESIVDDEKYYLYLIDHKK